MREIAQVTGLSEAEIWAGIEQQSKTAVRFEQEHTVTLEEHFKAIRHALETSLKPKSFEPWDDALTKFTGFSIAITPSRNGDMATWWTTFHVLWSAFLCQRRDHQRAARSTVTPLSSSPPTPVYYCARCYGFTTVTSSPLKENSYLW